MQFVCNFVISKVVFLLEEREEEHLNVNEVEESSDFDIENIHNDNRKYKPYRDKKIMDKTNDATTTTTVKKTLTETDIREKVKKQLSKTQKNKHRRKIKKGEASLSSKQKRENSCIINDSW